MLLIAVSRGCCRGCRQSSLASSSRLSSWSSYTREQSDNDAVDRRRSHFVIVRLRGGLGLEMYRYYRPSLKL